MLKPLSFATSGLGLSNSKGEQLVEEGDQATISPKCNGRCIGWSNRARLTTGNDEGGTVLGARCTYYAIASQRNAQQEIIMNLPCFIVVAQLDREDALLGWGANFSNL